jgi:hypothetical protein
VRVDFDFPTPIDEVLVQGAPTSATVIVKGSHDAQTWVPVAGQAAPFAAVPFAQTHSPSQYPPVPGARSKVLSSKLPPVIEHVGAFDFS